MFVVGVPFFSTSFPGRWPGYRGHLSLTSRRRNCFFAVCGSFWREHFELLAFRMLWVENCILFFCRDLIMSNIHCNDFEYTKIHCELGVRKDPMRMLLIHCWIRKLVITQEWFFHLLFPPLKLYVGSICPSIVLGDNIYSYNIWRRHSSSEVSSYWTMTPAQPKLTLNSNFVFKDREINFSE